jgi:pimeloyl-ACP methyl ester carboxylesterase
MALVTPRITAPTLVLWGDRDGIASHAEQLELTAALRAELHVLRGVGHALHWEDPETTAALIARFVERKAHPAAA